MATGQLQVGDEVKNSQSYIRRMRKRRNVQPRRGRILAIRPGNEFDRESCTYTYLPYAQVRWDQDSGGDKEWVPVEDLALRSRTGKWGEENVQLRRGRILLPDGSRIRVREIGQGHATTAFLGPNNKVYLFTKEAARDPAKEVLYEAQSRRRHMHLPIIERVGHTADGHMVHRMPLYASLWGNRRRYPEAAAHARVLKNCWKSIWRFAHQSPDYTGKNWQLWLCVKQARQRGEVPPALEAAVKHLWETTQDWGPCWAFEFPDSNLAINPRTGRLILLDVIFDVRSAGYWCAG